jgi:serine/threonine protein kinase
MAVTLQPGELFAGCRILRVLGQGGMGVVYEAEHETLRRMVALKVVIPERAGDPEYRTRFLREARLAAAMDHPSAIPVFDAGEAEGVLFIIMRRVNGRDLGAVLEEHGPLPPQVVVDILQPVAAVLDAAHNQGLIHRDVKPANILIEESDDLERGGRVYLTDFGLAKRLDATRLTKESNMFLGTMPYAAPEQFQPGGGVDAKSDQYALACVVFEALTGELPFAGEDAWQMGFAHVSVQPPAVSERRQEIPSAVDMVVARGMAKAKEERFPTCSDFLDYLKDAVESAATKAKPLVVPPAEAAPPPRQETEAAPPPPKQETEAAPPPRQETDAAPPPPRQETDAAPPPRQETEAAPPPPRQETDAAPPPRQETDAAPPPPRQETEAAPPPPRQETEAAPPPVPESLVARDLKGRGIAEGISGLSSEERSAVSETIRSRHPTWWIGLALVIVSAGLVVFAVLAYPEASRPGANATGPIFTGIAGIVILLIGVALLRPWRGKGRKPSRH